MTWNRQAVRRAWRSEAAINWRTAVLLGLISSTFSTVISQLLASRIGRDAVVDWMVVGTIPLHDPALQVEPTWPVILGGILFHQWADFSWEVFFFGLLGRWTARLRPRTLVLVAGPWAVFTSAMEWLVLVPLFPFWQPVFPLEQPYWIGLLVHISSASMYPLFPWLRDWVSGRLPSPNHRFGVAWSGLAAGGALLCGVLAFCGAHDRELPWAGRDDGADQAYIRRMSTHHAQGVEVAMIAAARAADPHLRALARLMAAEQEGELKIFQQWWRSWFPLPFTLCEPEERTTMPGMLTLDQIDQLRNAQGHAFDALFVQFMSFHHAGAAVMADQEINGGGDPRLRVMAQAIRHAQQGEIGLMHGIKRIPAVRTAIMDLFSVRPSTTAFLAPGVQREAEADAGAGDIVPAKHR